MKKKLPCYEILTVSSQMKGKPYTTSLRPVWVSEMRGGKPPDGCYVGNAGFLYLPKRKRGEKFVVRFTEMKEVAL